MILALIYFAVVLLGFFFVTFRNKTSLVRGKSFLKFNLIFLSVAIALSLAGKAFGENFFALSSTAVVVVLSFFSRNIWLLFKYNSTKTSIVIEDSLSRILIPFQRIENKYILKSMGSVNTYLQLRSFWPGCAIIVIREDRHSKKVEVLKSLLVKNFSAVFPRIVIKLK